MRITLIVLAAILLAFAVVVATNSQSLIGSVHQRNFHDLDVAVRGLETWPADMRLVAKNRYSSSQTMLRREHPEIGTYEIRYDADCKEPDDTRTFRPGANAGQGTVFFVRDEFVPAPPPPVASGGKPAPAEAEPAKPICFSTEVPLDRLVLLDQAAPEFSHLLILAEDGRVVAQAGDNPLPVTQLAEFAPPNATLSEFARRVLKEAPPTAASAQVRLGDAGGSRVSKDFAGDRFRAYVRPFRIEGNAEACLPRIVVAPAAAGAVSAAAPAAAATGGATPAAKLTVDAASAKVRHDGYCYAVGLMPESRLRGAWLSPPPVTLVGFALVLVVFVALLPLIRLLLIGHAESVSFVEAVGIVIGLQVAAAIGMLAVLFFAEVAAERQTARGEATRVATRMKTQADDEIAAVLERFAEFRTLEKDTLPSKNCVASNSADLTGYFCPPGAGPAADAGVGSAAARSIGSLIVSNEDGLRARNTIAFDREATDRQDLSEREYFRALRRGDTLSLQLFNPPPPRTEGEPACDPVFAASAAASGELRYTLAQVRSQIDGVAKTVFAVACNTASKAPTVADDAPANAGERGELYLTGASQLYSFQAPVLPDPLRFLVIDLGDPRLPVLFHHNRFRAGTENFAERVEGADRELAALRALRSGGAPDPIPLTLRYDGAVADFAAMPLTNANWAVLVYVPRNRVDRVAATSAVWSIVDWFSIALIGLVLAGVRLWFNPERWRDLWPDESEAVDNIYGRTRSQLLVAALGALALVTLAATSDRFVWIGLVVAIACWAGSVGWFNRQLSRRPQTAKALSPMTERRYGQLCLTMLVCVAVVPMIAFWSDARVTARELTDTRRAAAAVQAIADRSDRLKAVLQATPLRTMRDAAAQIEDEGLPTNLAVTPLPKIIEVPASLTFARLAESTRSFLPDPPSRRCDGAPAAVWLCRGGTPPSERIATVPRRTDWGLSGLAWFGVAVLLLIVAAVVATTLLLGLQAMMGFGVPLGAVKLTKFKADEISPRTLLVAPQTPVRSFFNTKDGPWRLDLAEILLTTAKEELWDHAAKTKFDTLFEREKDRRDTDSPFRLIVSGLSLILRDAPRRGAALKMLETADRRLDAHELSSIVIVSDFSPLERILDAFDSEETGEGGALTTREELRWARLFQRYNTKQFSPLEKVDMEDPRIKALDRKAIAHAGDLGAYTLVRELRWLPAIIIDSLLPNPPTPGEFAEAEQAVARQRDPTAGGTAAGHGDAREFPIDKDVYRRVYTAKVIAWAVDQNVPSPAAAVDLLRTTLIEHYEQCWAASTLSERLVLDAMARSHFVNMRNALALQSLVRRGLVILDPAPRLMNRSFAQFVRQIERPDTLRKWRERQPRSGWLTARLPVLATVAAGAVFLAVGAAESGQQLSALLALVVAGGPTLVSLLHRAVRPSG
ncbi:MAG: hypothetical protein ABW194_10135 [Novosphingobium sp.]